METSLQCWFYQCQNPECNAVGIVNDVVLRERYADGAVPCPLCSHGMERIREAQPGEYDQEEQEAIAARVAYTWDYKIVPPWEVAAYMNPRPCMFGCEHYRNGHQVRESSLPPQAHTAVDDQDLKFLTEADVARILAVSVRVVRKLVKDKRLQPIKLTKRKKLFTRAVVDEFIQREAGPLSPVSGENYPPGNLHGPKSRPIPLEESRSLVKNIRRHSSECSEKRSTSAESRR